MRASMLRGSRLGQWVGLALVLSAACGPAAEPQTGSETHFLVYCDGQCEAGLSCICGTCTQPCSTDADCARLAPTAECIAVQDRPADASCFECGADAFCDVRCAADGDCAALGPSHTCQRGFCRAPEAMGIGADARVDLDEVCDFYRQDLCAAELQCYGWDYRDAEHCQQATECWGETLVRDAVAAGRIAYDAAATYACHRRMQEDPCSLGVVLFAPDLGGALDLCGSITGLQPAGGSCQSDSECAPGLDCLDSLACPGTCQARGQAGDACGTDLPLCAAALTCHDDVCRSMTWTMGEPCSETTDCGGNVIDLTGEYQRLWCDVALGQCASLGGLGQACTLDGGAAAPPCQRGLRCDASDLFGLGVCQPIGGAGESCFYDSGCTDPLVCVPVDAASVTAPGACAPRSAAGGPCKFDSHCLAGLYCDARVCAAIPAAGDACSGTCGEGLECRDAVCQSILYPGDPCDPAADACTRSRCVGGTCALAAPLGTPCTTSDECLSGVCDAVCADPAGCG
jgi:hypothetical protein